MSAHAAHARTANPTPWWFWLVALVGVPFAAIGVFIGLGAGFGWTESGAWLAVAIAAFIGWGTLISLGARLGIDRLWTGAGVVLATVATPAWAFAVVYALFAIYCDGGCFN
jgi:hypothetical protein